MMGRRNGGKPPEWQEGNGIGAKKQRLGDGPRMRVRHLRVVSLVDLLTVTGSAAGPRHGSE
jgi:hypothetical protein